MRLTIERGWAGSLKGDFLEISSKIWLLTRDQGSKKFYNSSKQINILNKTSEHNFFIPNFTVTFLLPIRRKLRIYDFRPLEGPHKIFLSIFVIKSHELVN